MDAPPRGALILVRFVAAGLIGMGLLDSGLYLAECFVRHLTILPGRVLVEILPLLAGVPVLIKARALADWLSELLD